MKKKFWIAFAAGFAVVLVVVAVILMLVNQPMVVGISYREHTNPSNMAFRRALEDTLTAQGIQVIVTDADGDHNKQLEQINQLRDRKCDALIVEPVSAEAGEALLEAIGKTGLPAVLYNRKMAEGILEGYPNIAHIGLDESQSGAKQGELVLQLPNCGDINGDGVVSCFVLEGPRDHTHAVLRGDAVRQVLSAGEAEIQELTVGYGDWTRESGKTLCSQELAKYGKDIEVILCGNDQMALGAAQAIADGGRTVGKDVYLLGIDGDAEAIELIRQGNMTGTVSKNEPAQIQTIVETVMTQLKGKTVQQYQVLPYIKVTVDNAEEFGQ